MEKKYQESYMELNLENDLILDYIYQLHMFEYEHLFLENRIIPMTKENLLIKIVI